VSEPNFTGMSKLPPEQADIARQQEIARTTKMPAILQGKLVSGSVTDAAEVSVTHGLGRTPQGWWLLSPSGDADRICLVQTGKNSKTITVVNTGATGSLSFQLWVF
jgi:hypothetical protein